MTESNDRLGIIHNLWYLEGWHGSLKAALLKYNCYVIYYTHLKCTVLCFWHFYILMNLRHNELFFITHKGSLILLCNPYSHPSLNLPPEQQLICFLSLYIGLHFQKQSKNHVVYMLWCLPSVIQHKLDFFYVTCTASLFPFIAEQKSLYR